MQISTVDARKALAGVSVMSAPVQDALETINAIVGKIRDRNSQQMFLSDLANIAKHGDMPFHHDVDATAHFHHDLPEWAKNLLIHQTIIREKALLRYSFCDPRLAERIQRAEVEYRSHAYRFVEKQHA